MKKHIFDNKYKNNATFITVKATSIVWALSQIFNQQNKIVQVFLWVTAYHDLKLCCLCTNELQHITSYI